ncbi:hypothetical protein QQF64_001042 [Cirrhinus molitorella]|uniref:Uncharacterized protein n=1 Tax=Cirrhinus molitorella TaxID=172907 RepID=A0ABR3NYX2_9TELE
MPQRVLLPRNSIQYPRRGDVYVVSTCATNHRENTYTQAVSQEVSRLFQHSIGQYTKRAEYDWLTSLSVSFQAFLCFLAAERCFEGEMGSDFFDGDGRGK